MRISGLPILPALPGVRSRPPWLKTGLGTRLEGEQQHVVVGSFSAATGTAHYSAGARRRSRQPVEAIDRSAGPTRRLLWRRAPHHPFRIVQLPEFEYPPDLRPDAVQRAQPVAAHADGL